MGIKRFSRNSILSGNDRTAVALDWDFSETELEFLPPRRTDLSENPFYLTIIHINDLHAGIFGFDGNGGSVPVFSRIVSAASEVYSETEGSGDKGSLFLSAGDDSTGTPLDHFAGYDGKNFHVHSVYEAYSLAGVDAAVTGNHDFDAGIDTLRKSIAEDADFPVLSANLIHNGRLSGLVFPAALIVIKGVRIGLIGLTTQGQIRSRPGSEFDMENPLDAYRRIYSKLEGLCDSIIVLSHLGYKLGSVFAAVKPVGDCELAEALSGDKPDLIVGGHTHDFLNINGFSMNNHVNGIPVTQAGFNGIFYGKTVLRIGSSVSIVSSTLNPSVKEPECSEFSRRFSSGKTGRLLDTLKAPIGRLNFVENDDAFRPSSAGFQPDNPMICFITDSIMKIVNNRGFKADLAFADGNCVTGDFRRGSDKVDLIELYRLMPYADTIVLIELSGEELIEIIKTNAYRTAAEDEPYTEKGFLFCSGNLRYSIDCGKGIVDKVELNGKPVSGIKKVVAAMPNYTQGLSRGWESEFFQKTGKELFSVQKADQLDTGLYLRNEIINFIDSAGISKETGYCSDDRVRVI